MNLSILQDLVKNTDSCPGKLNHLNINDYNNLVNHAIIHKAVPFLYHLYVCKNCKIFFTTKQSKKILNLINHKKIISEEITKYARSLDHLSKKLKIKMLHHKNTDWLAVYNRTHLFRTSSDIDILINKDRFNNIDIPLFKKGWELKEKNEVFSRLTGYKWQEKVFQQKNNKTIKLDIQSSAGATYNSIICLLKKIDLEILVTNILKKKKTFGLLKLHRSEQLIIMTSHFAFHDKFFGLRSAFEIKEISTSLDKSDWKKALLIAKQNRLLNVFMFVMLVIEKMFSIELIPERYNKYLDRRLVILSYLFPITNLQNTNIRTGIRMGLLRNYANCIFKLSII